MPEVWMPLHARKHLRFRQKEQVTYGKYKLRKNGALKISLTDKVMMFYDRLSKYEGLVKKKIDSKHIINYIRQKIFL